MKIEPRCASCGHIALPTRKQRNVKQQFMHLVAYPQEEGTEISMQNEKDKEELDINGSQEELESFSDHVDMEMNSNHNF